ncbi:MAG: hypothetical protein P4M11_14105 [Candidatus Pacebacteria bacterium]|nr:hypothetical protein [Candidatus Paceibacterota bacterium]
MKEKYSEELELEVEQEHHETRTYNTSEACARAPAHDEFGGESLEIAQYSAFAEAGGEAVDNGGDETDEEADNIVLREEAGDGDEYVSSEHRARVHHDSFHVHDLDEVARVDQSEHAVEYY